MSIAELKSLLLVSTAIHYVILLIWFAAFTLFHDRLLGVHRRWFDLTPQTFDALHYGAMGVYKIGVLLLNLVPLLALIALGK